MKKLKEVIKNWGPIILGVLIVKFGYAMYRSSKAQKLKAKEMNTKVERIKELTNYHSKMQQECEQSIDSNKLKEILPLSEEKWKVYSKNYCKCVATKNFTYILKTNNKAEDKLKDKEQFKKNYNLCSDQTLKSIVTTKYPKEADRIFPPNKK